MAKKGKKRAQPEEEHSLNVKLSKVGMRALEAFAIAIATALGTTVASPIQPIQPPVVVVVDTQKESPKSYQPVYPDTRSKRGSVDPPEEFYRITIHGDEGVKHDFVIKDMPQHVAAPALAPVDVVGNLPTTPSPLLVRTDLWGAPEGYTFHADKDHMLAYFANNFDLDPNIKEALSRVTEIQIAKADHPGETAGNNPGSATPQSDETT